MSKQFVKRLVAGVCAVVMAVSLVACGGSAAQGITDLTVEQRTRMLRFANMAAYIVTTRKGAIRSMPERSLVEEMLGKD